MSSIPIKGSLLLFVTSIVKLIAGCADFQFQEQPVRNRCQSGIKNDEIINQIRRFPNRTQLSGY